MKKPKSSQANETASSQVGDSAVPTEKPQTTSQNTAEEQTNSSQTTSAQSSKSKTTSKNSAKNKREFPQNRYTVLSILIFPLKKFPLTSLVYLNFH